MNSTHDEITTSPIESFQLDDSFPWLTAAAAACRTSAGKSILVFLLGGIFGRVVERINKRPAPPPKKAAQCCLPEVRLAAVSATEAKDTAGECPVCLHDFDDRDPCCRLPCSHIFHRDCINRWLARGSRSCPICRMDAGTPVGGAGLRQRA